VPTVKPLDSNAILDAVGTCRAVVTVEEHMVHGGLGEACAAAMLEAGRAPRFRIAGIPDEYTVTGSQSDIFRHYGLSMEGLAAMMRELLDS
jgi:transketolase